MSRALLVYGAFLLLGLGFLGWRLSKMPPVPAGVKDLDPTPTARYEERSDAELPFPYDLSGKIAAFRARRPDAGEDAVWPQPLFWMKGNLQVVVDDDWNDDRPRYRVATLPRAELESLMKTLDGLPRTGAGSSTEGELLLERRDRDGGTLARSTSRTELSQIIEQALEGRESRPYTPQALEVLAQPAPEGATSAAWPIRTLNLAKLLTASRTVLTRPSDIERALEIADRAADYQQGDSRARIEIHVLTDRP